jgi:hypothetical protein
MGRKRAGRLSGLITAPPGLGPTSSGGKSLGIHPELPVETPDFSLVPLLTAWLLMWPDGPDGSKGPTSRPSALIFPFTTTRENPLLLRCSPRRAAARPARRLQRRQRPQTRRRRSWPSSLPPALTRSHTARGLVRRTLATERGASPSPSARRVPPVRAKPWARWGAADRVVRSHTPA